jgi:DNA repair exonuclease SbcCD ATPase subunit
MESESSVGVVMLVAQSSDDAESKKEEVKNEVKEVKKEVKEVKEVKKEVKEVKEVKETEAKKTEATPAGADITIPKHLLHKAQKTVIKTAPKQSSCTECGKKHDSHSRECTWTVSLVITRITHSLQHHQVRAAESPTAVSTKRCS